MWLTLAAYNIGYGHLEDARVLTQRLGGNPDSWADVREHLPLLEDEAYHTTLKHGFARGSEALRFVEGVRTYRTLLEWHSRRQLAEHQAQGGQGVPSISASSDRNTW
jgi:membrane-bound lytic murein transglycosylase F